MTDKNLKELQDIIHDAFMLQSRITAWQCHAVNDGDVRQYPPLKDIRAHITAAISGMHGLEEEMKRREGK